MTNIGNIKLTVKMVQHYDQCPRKFKTYKNNVFNFLHNYIYKKPECSSTIQRNKNANKHDYFLQIFNA